MSRLLICVPTYNEADNVAPLAQAIFANVNDSTEILFIDDGSPDGTGKILDQMTIENPRIHVIHRAGKQGLATAYIAGFQWALARNYDWVAEMDCDFSHDPKHLQDVERLIASDQYDVLCGSRYVPGGGVSNWSRGRLLLSMGGSMYARMILSYPVRDWTGGFNFWRTRCLDALKIATIHSRGYSFQIELKYRARILGLRFHEFPIVFQERRAGQSKMSGSIVKEALMGVIRLRLAKEKDKLFE